MAFCLLTFLIIDLASVDKAYNNAAIEASRSYASQAETEIAATCKELPVKSHATCIKKFEHAAREDQRAEQDLAAQKITAWWTKVMGAAALIGMTLSAIGIVLVWTTFSETKRTNLISLDQLKLAKDEARLRDDAIVRLIIDRRAVSQGGIRYWANLHCDGTGKATDIEWSLRCEIRYGDVVLRSWDVKSQRQPLMLGGDKISLIKELVSEPTDDFATDNEWQKLLQMAISNSLQIEDEVTVSFKNAFGDTIETNEKSSTTTIIDHVEAEFGFVQELITRSSGFVEH